MLTFEDFGIWPKLELTSRLTNNKLQEQTRPMPDELSMSKEDWERLLTAQIDKGKPKPPKAKTAKPASKPYTEKSFVSVHYTALGVSDSDTSYNSRDALTYVVLHFYLRDGDSWAVLQKDAREYAAMFPHSKIIAHDHAFNEPCSPAPATRKCRQV